MLWRNLDTRYVVRRGWCCAVSSSAWGCLWPIFHGYLKTKQLILSNLGGKGGIALPHSNPAALLCLGPEVSGGAHVNNSLQHQLNFDSTDALIV